ncbi:MAG: hypothetical protein VB122_04850 [Erysipelotrichales bacterium]|nr:hypothetical protein [Erysipelotrichales bacterium]
MENKEQIQRLNQKIVELTNKYDCTKKVRAAMDMRGQNSSHLYQEMIAIEMEIKSIQKKRDVLIRK